MIELGKTYPDKSGNQVRIICVDRQDDTPIVGLLMMEDVEYLACYTAGGQYIPDEPSANDLILPEDYSSYKIDEPVMVRDHGEGDWLPRYFAGMRGGKPYTWNLGATSWSNAKRSPVLWNQCRRPTAEELGEKQ